ncbi:MAG: hypothetical protein DBX91_15695 [Subdoligranulum variabile]|jgi:hypothetical protein|nr:MAG: hypothetical protein DBX91_15695 [Subdoligranulum variabile]
MKKIICITLCVCLLLFSFACSASSSSKTEEEIRQDNLQKLEDAASVAAEQGTDFWSNVESDIHEVDENCVYFTPNGKSFHSTKDCVALVNSKTILSGTLEEAIMQGKSDPCSKCVG